ncbi:MAG TPA: hypothetical protein VK689_00200 [Armatimonadota bacterium]|nr:hypothetical protein [Armatimonadota bacterium]
MALKSGLWLTFVDEAGEATPAECKIVEREPGRWVLDAVIPPQVYPVTFVSARLRLDGDFLGMLRFPEPITTVTHEPKDLRLEFPVNEEKAGAQLENR